jgi:hypothetical protein
LTLLLRLLVKEDAFISFASPTSAKKRMIKRPDVRSLKIQPKVRFNRWSTSQVPEIKLCGEWLHRLGFESNSRVTVTTMPGLLILRVDDDKTGLPY